MKLWGGRFTKPTSQLVDEYTASIYFDKKLAVYDIEGSLAHVAMLGKCEIITKEEAKTIAEGLQKVASTIESGEAILREEHEDIHMNVERLLIEAIGPVGGKLHTGRSRNDQVALDMRLYLRDALVEITQLAVQVQQALVKQATANMDTILPGYTHLQRAQPVLFSHHLLAYAWMFQRDIERLIDSWKRVNQSPLGAGALAGTTFPIDRKYVAQQLAFEGICENSLDAVSDRDFVVEFLSDASMISMHLSRLCEEIVQWSSQEFNFIEIDDEFSTGSSMMPQKKNPDVAELVRGKTGRVYGHLMGMLTTLKGLPLAYNKDMQEDKEGMFDTVETLRGALSLFAPMIESMNVNKEAMYKAVQNDYSNATDFADYLVGKGITFRESHAITGETVLYCIKENKYLTDLTIKEFQTFSNAIESDIYDYLAPEAVVQARNATGGTAKNQVTAQLKKVTQAIEKNNQWVSAKNEILSSRSYRSI
ncbi:argininosuccinate lyase [Virgibacillus salexigens]|uniref:Argininosuccinate lyase n=2 Tax=Virgibacillus TaxID=84406 RepID=A0A024Q767_9BACI|nr:MULTISPECIES: argininosuccinate lyase [Virgibacillus]GGJ53970.1 argininosuccinate lyase [Virgibacillus kapii]CDQ38132.1 Argininosuccinate lyase 1 [Virgibacillus massiliensis]